MRQRLVSDELWEVVEPLLPPESPELKGGRPRLSDRAALEGIAFPFSLPAPSGEGVQVFGIAVRDRLLATLEGVAAE